jgi:Spy/CpxP family protein refolding chaperone
MKKIISVVCALVLVSVVAFAQDKKQKDPEKWREKVRAEQVAMITSELDLTEAEAQAFWPVYNEVQKQRREAFQASGEAFKALKEGVDGPDVNNLLNNYLDAKKQCEDLETEALIRYKKVLPVQKVAKLVMAEEKFRHQQIGKLGGKGNRPGPGDMPMGHRSNRPPVEN